MKQDNSALNHIPRWIICPLQPWKSLVTHCKPTVIDFHRLFNICTSQKEPVKPLLYYISLQTYLDFTTGPREGRIDLPAGP